MNCEKSAGLYQKALQYFPGGVNSPVRAFRSVGGTPLFIKKGKGSRIWDADGNEYIDFCGSWGPLILGHAHPAIVQAVKESAEDGTSFGAPTEKENQLAELILGHHRFLKKLRFVSSGTEAVMSAIRLARGYTGKSKIIKFDGCYHGHADSLLVKAGSGLVTFGTSSSAGVPESFAKETIVVPLNDKEALEKVFEKGRNDIACVIIEPVPANNGLLIQDKGFLEFLRDICSKNESLLIFDEVISGFRLGFEGAAGLYDIQPDIITFGKIIGGGLPVGAYGASERIMSAVSPEGPVYQAGTLSGNPVAMAAGIAQLKECLKPGFYSELDEKTSAFTGKINRYSQSKGYKFGIIRMGSVFWLSFSDKPEIRRAEEIDGKGINLFNALYHHLLENGIYMGPSGYEVGFVSAAHSEEELDKAAEVLCRALDRCFSKAAV
jgi:glutamate-1-semialdehyde 2,1-aminomutase